MKKTMMIMAAAICIATPAMAMSNSDTNMMADHMMKMGDTNGDGMISKDEMSAMNAKRFDMMDTNHDGMVSKDEMMAGMKMEHDQMMGKGAMMSHDSMSKDSMSKDSTDSSGMMNK